MSETLTPGANPEEIGISDSNPIFYKLQWRYEPEFSSQEGGGPLRPV